MKQISATKAKSNFGEVLLFAMNNPIVITKNNKDIAVIMSAEIYKKMINITNEIMKNYEERI